MRVKRLFDVLDVSRTRETLRLISDHFDRYRHEQTALLAAGNADLHATVGLRLRTIVAERRVHGDVNGRASLARVVLVDETRRVWNVEAGGEPADDGDRGVHFFVGVERGLGKLDVDGDLEKTDKHTRSKAIKSCRTWTHT